MVELELNVGKIPVSFTSGAGGQLVGEMRQRDPEFGEIFGAEVVARATGVPLDFIDTSLPIEPVSTGTAFTIVALKSLAAMWGNCAWTREARAHSPRNTQANSSILFRGRPRRPVRPCTRACSFITVKILRPARLRDAARRGRCSTAYSKARQQGLIEQGLEIGRPSFLRIRGRKTDVGVTDVCVGGGVVEIARGEFVLR